jgi:TetR/AcrR family transcriptional regulator, cholesterol catabolism regulator
MPVRQPRKRMDPSVRAEHILNVALQLFAERHYGTVSVRDIAEACGINAGLIYYYYQSKDELLRRALGHAIAELQAGYDLGEHLNPAQELTAWLRMHVPIAPMLLRMVKIMADYAASNIRDANTDRMIQNFYTREQNFLENCLRRGIALRVFRPVDVAASARAFSLQLDGIFYASQARGDRRIELDIENLCSIAASPALAVTP